MRFLGTSIDVPSSVYSGSSSRDHDEDIFITNGRFLVKIDWYKTDGRFVDEMTVSKSQEKLIIEYSQNLK